MRQLLIELWSSSAFLLLLPQLSSLLTELWQLGNGLNSKRNGIPLSSSKLRTWNCKRSDSISFRFLPSSYEMLIACHSLKPETVFQTFQPGFVEVLWGLLQDIWRSISPSSIHRELASHRVFLSFFRSVVLYFFILLSESLHLGAGSLPLAPWSCSRPSFEMRAILALCGLHFKILAVKVRVTFYSPLFNTAGIQTHTFSRQVCLNFTRDCQRCFAHFSWPQAQHGAPELHSDHAKVWWSVDARCFCILPVVLKVWKPSNAPCSQKVAIPFSGGTGANWSRSFDQCQQCQQCQRRHQIAACPCQKP